MGLKTISIDTNAYTAFKLGNEPILQVFQNSEIIAFSVIVIAELMAGFTNGTKQTKNKSELDELLNSPRIRVLTIDQNTIPFYTHIYTALRKKGKPVPTNDMWIAASAMQHGCAICTLDKHFQHIEGLISGTCWTDFI